MGAPVLPGLENFVQLVLRHASADEEVCVVADEASAAELERAGRKVRRAASLAEVGPSAFVLFAAPTRLGPLIPQAMALHDALPPGGRAVVADVVWWTAPSAELMRAFAPAPGREKVRPIEGYEMQLEHAGFEKGERVVVGRDAWLAFLPPEDARRAPIEADARGACRVAAWVLTRGNL